MANADVNQNEDDKKYEITTMQKRIKALGIIFVLFFAAISGRLFWIQVIQHDSLTSKAVPQRLMTIQTSVSRGQIYDRNMIPFTDRELKKVIAVSNTVMNKDATVDIIAKAAGLSKAEVKYRLEEIEDTIEITAKEFNNEYLDMIEKGTVKGVSAIERKTRYSDTGLASHVIGYIGKSDKKGMMGIEKSMNNFLDQGGAESIVAVVDSSKNIIPGLGFRKVEANPNGEKYSLKLTLDYHIQKIAEEVLESNNINGSAVVTDVHSGDILAMVSTPDFDPNNLGQHISNGGDELINKAVWPYDLGSIFKTVVAAAAIENNLVDENETFLCEGEIESGNSVIKCATYENTHKDRPLTLKEAFALSCNTTFVKVGTRVGAEKVLEMAKRLGLGSKQCSEIPEEKAGYIPTIQEDGIGNISIGQGKIQVTPLQVATMMSIIANNGILYKPNIIDQLVTNDTGATVKKMPRSTPEMVLNASTVSRLKTMMHEVTTTGTGKQANLEDFGGSSGKTSSAETGINSGSVVHGWFAGFVPSDRPQYSITVFVYNGQSGGKAAAPIFREIANRIFTEYKPLH